MQYVYEQYDGQAIHMTNWIHKYEVQKRLQKNLLKEQGLPLSRVWIYLILPLLNKIDFCFS